MGEYALVGKERVKIGTCEEMYYLRADQVGQITPESGNVNPKSREEAEQIRFRFPFPEEDGCAPGAFDDYEKGLAVPDIQAPKEGFTHRTARFTNSRGYLIELPCPEKTMTDDSPLAQRLNFQRNGYKGAVRICQQRLVDGKLVLVCECGGCGAKWRVPTLEEAKPIIAAFRGHLTPGDYYQKIAQRIEDGYTKPNFWSSYA